MAAYKKVYPGMELTLHRQEVPAFVRDHLIDSARVHAAALMIFDALDGKTRKNRPAEPMVAHSFRAAAAVATSPDLYAPLERLLLSALPKKIQRERKIAAIVGALLHDGEEDTSKKPDPSQRLKAARMVEAIGYQPGAMKDAVIALIRYSTDTPGLKDEARRAAQTEKALALAKTRGMLRRLGGIVKAVGDKNDNLESDKIDFAAGRLRPPTLPVAVAMIRAKIGDIDVVDAQPGVPDAFKTAFRQDAYQLTQNLRRYAEENFGAEATREALRTLTMAPPIQETRISFKGTIRKALRHALNH